ncbi:MAG: ABC transporter substrate-binding protein [Acetobacteraceae bacterium]|nr:ABC transporter substrate-binding protein [Acetobacteraceae bacterium]
MPEITRRGWMQGVAATTAAIAGARGAAAQNSGAGDVARADTLIATGQPSGGAPTFTQYNDFNPFHPGLDLRSSVAFVLEPLFYYSVLPDKMIPWLAASYEYNPDYTELTVHLRQGVTWNDGKPFSADDVIFTLDMLRQNGRGKGDQTYASAMARDIKDLVRVDDHTVRIALNHRDPRWMFTYLTVRFTEGAFILPKHVYETAKPDDLGSFTGLSPAGPNGPVGTGAFKIASMTPERIVLDQRDDWWGVTTGFSKPPQMKRVIFVPFTTHEQAAQLIGNGDVDTILEAYVPMMKSLLSRFPDRITCFSGNKPPYGNIDWWPTSLIFNHDDPQFHDVRIRRAVSLYLNRKQAVDYAYQGAAAIYGLPYPRYPRLEQYFPAMEGTIKQLRILDYDNAAADALMKEAGAVKDASGVWTLNGKQMGGDLYFPISLDAIGPVVAEQLRRAGFKVAPNTRPGYRNEVFYGRAAWFLWGHGASVNDPYQTLALYHKRVWRPIGENPFWPSRWRNDEFSDLVDKIEALAPDDAGVPPLVDQALTIWLREQVACPISQYYHRIPFSQTYWKNWPSEKDPYINPTFWHNTGTLLLLGLQKA